jgi:hypothetical protein
MLRLIAYISEKLLQEDWYNEEQLATKLYSGLCVLILYLTSKIGIHLKLKIGQPGDVYEQETDRVAEQVMRMSSYTTNKRPSGVSNSLKILHSDAVEPTIQFSKKSNTNNIQNAVPSASGIPQSASIPGLSFAAPSHPFHHGRSPLPQRPVNSNGVCIPLQ